MKNIIMILIISIMMTGCLKEEKADAYGTITANEIYISSKISAEITETSLLEGAKVTKGDIIAVLDTTDIDLTIKELQRNIEMIENKLSARETEIELLKQEKENLEIDQNRFVQLIKSEAAAGKKLDDINAALKLQDLRIKQAGKSLQIIRDEIAIANIKLQQAESQKEKHFITTPIDGTILEKYYQTGEMAIMGKPIFKLANLQTMQADLYVSETLLPEIMLGGEVKIKIDSRNKSQKTFMGIVTKIASEAEFTPKIIQTREERTRLVYKIEVECQNDGSLKIGMPVEMEL